MYRILSYTLNTNSPLYGDTKAVSIDVKKKELEENSCCMTSRISFSNHSGTHVDAPKHFYSDGREISQYNIDELIFKSPQLIDCPKDENELIMADDLKLLETTCDLLLIRTGFYKYRSEEKYRLFNPGISPEAAEFIREKYPHIRAIGIDTISISAYQNRDAGRRAHRLFLTNRGFSSQPILLIEDLNLSGELSKLIKVYVAPLFVEGVDSMPCTVIGEFN